MHKFFLGLGSALLVFSGFSCTRPGTALENASLPDTKTVVRTYDSENNRSMQFLDMLVMRGLGSVGEIRPYIDEKDPKARWVAVYVIGRVADPSAIKLLLPLLRDEDEIVRISAAGTLANKGYKEALPVLISSLDSSGVIEYLSPQRNIADFCLDVLSTYTKQPMVTKEDWQEWWNANGETLRWDEATRQYRL